MVHMASMERGVQACSRVVGSRGKAPGQRVSGQSLPQAGGILISDAKDKIETEKINSNKITTTVLWPFFRDHPGEPVPGENFWTLWCKGRLTAADTLTNWLGATPSGLTSAYLHHPLIFFYRLDALPAAQPTASKH